MITAFLTFLAFWALLAATVTHPDARRAMLGRTRGEWAVDLAGLLVQGAAVPALAAAIGLRLLPDLAPGLHGAVDIPPVAGFLINFIAVDWLYYWNHRLLHGRSLWPAHALHHGGSTLDLFATSRNTAWTPLVLVYLWAHASALYVLQDPTGYLLGMACTSALDLWRHCPGLDPPGAAGRWLSLLLVTPGQHALHHSAGHARTNFGANLNLWDRLHGTFRPALPVTPLPGIPLRLPLLRQFLFPFGPRPRLASAPLHGKAP